MHLPAAEAAGTLAANDRHSARLLRESSQAGQKLFAVHAVMAASSRCRECTKRKLDRGREAILPCGDDRAIPSLHPVLVVIDSGRAERLGRIKPELWGNYDGFEINRTKGSMSFPPRQERPSRRSRSSSSGSSAWAKLGKSRGDDPRF